MTKHARKIQRNFGVFISVLSALVLTIAPSFLVAPSARASLIVARPLYIGLDSGLVGYWSFDGPDLAANTAYDRSGNANNGTLTNGPVRAIGKIGQALDFDGIDDSVNVGTSDALLADNAPLTICTWIYPRTIGENSLGRIIERRTPGEVSFFLETNNVIRFFAAGATSLRRDSNNNSITLNAWQSACVTWDGGTTATNAHIYINGTEVGYQLTQNQVTPTDNSGAATIIGNRQDGSRTFDGLIDEVRVYNRILSADEIKRLYNIGGTLKINKPVYSGSLTTGLVGYWSFDGPDLAANTAFDRSGQSNNGTISGATKTVGRIGQALDFDGSDDYVNAGSGASLDDLTTGTISAWIYPRSSGEGANGYIVSKAANFTNDGWSFAIPSSKLFFEWDGATSDWERGSNNTLTLNQWTHAVVTFNRDSASPSATNILIYENGVEVTYTAPLDGNTLDSDAASNLVIGNDRIFNLARTFDGFIDETRIYNRILSADEIKRLYNIGGTLKINKPVYSGSLTTGLVGYWSFDGPDMSGTTAIDRSGQGNNGTLTNGPVRTVGKIGQALNFDGSNDYVDTNVEEVGGVDLFATSGTAWSVSIWGKQSANGTLIARGSADTGTRQFQIYNQTTGTNNPTIVLRGIQNTYDLGGLNGLWHHYVVTWDGTTAKFYFDSVAQTNPTVGTAAEETGQRIIFGARTNGTGFFLNGSIDEVRIYNRALSADEIKRLYEIGR